MLFILGDLGPNDVKNGQKPAHKSALK